LTAFLLAAVLLSFAPQESDAALARQLFAQALDRHAELDTDSSLVLLKAARDTDFLSLPLHYQYIHEVVSRLPEPLRTLRAEYEALPDSPLIRCLRAYVAVPHYNLPAAEPALRQMEASGAGGPCPVVLLARILAEMRPVSRWVTQRLEYCERTCGSVAHQLSHRPGSLGTRKHSSSRGPRESASTR